VPVHGVVFLVALDQPDRLAVELDQIMRFAVVGMGRVLDGFARITPPARDTWIAEDLDELRLVARLDGAKYDALSAKLRRRG